MGSRPLPKKNKMGTKNQKKKQTWEERELGRDERGGMGHGNEGYGRRERVGGVVGGR